MVSSQEFSDGSINSKRKTDMHVQHVQMKSISVIVLVLVSISCGVESK